MDMQLLKKNIFISVILLFLTGQPLYSQQNNAIRSSVQDTSVSDTIPVQINHEMLRMFEAFKERGAITETFYDRILQEAEKQDPERWRQLLEEFRGAIEQGDDPFEQEEFIELVTEEVETFLSEDTLQLPANARHRDSPAEHTLIMDKTMERTQDMVRYHIQLAASTEPLDDASLQKLHTGNRAVFHFREDQWIKYFTGNFHHFDQAREALRQTDAPGAYIVAYVSGKRIMAYQGRQVEKVFAATTLQTFHNDEQDQYRIQIAASQRPLTDIELNRLYAGTKQIGIIYEDQWYKYSIPATPTLSEAWDFVKSINIEGAYVVRYRKGKLLPLQ